MCVGEGGGQGEGRMGHEWKSEEVNDVNDITQLIAWTREALKEEALDNLP